MTDFTQADPLLQLLIENKSVTESQAEEAWEEQKRTGNALRKVVIDMQLITENDLLILIANHLGTTLVDLSEMEIAPEVFKAIPGSAARMYNVVPVGMEANSLTLATCDLPAPHFVDEIRFAFMRDVSFVFAREDDIKTLINRHYEDDSVSVSDLLSTLESDIKQGSIVTLAEDNEDENALTEMANLAPVVRFVSLILYEAVRSKASDIHFEPFEKEFKIRYRVDGALLEMAPPPKELALPVISRIKVMSNLNIALRRIPQDGRLQMKILGRPIDFRVSTLPTQFGESVVLRILDRSTVSLDLENLGMPSDVYDLFSADIKKPNGIIIVTGPTGSGKTTTMYSALQRLNRIESKVLTVEDPVEYDIEGIIQVQTNDAIGMSFQRILRHFLRQDPDIIMIGEIRDLETAQIAIQAALTGHLVLTTLHTNDSPGAITRLIDMNVEPFLISSTLEAVFAQRLLRVVCTKCKTSYQPDDDLLKQLNLTHEIVAGRPFFYGKGCPECHETGYRGRKGIFEYLSITPAIRSSINERKPTQMMREKAKEEGMRLLRDDGLRNIFDGFTTAEEVLKYT